MDMYIKTDKMSTITDAEINALRAAVHSLNQLQMTKYSKSSVDYIERQIQAVIFCINFYEKRNIKPERFNYWYDIPKQLSLGAKLGFAPYAHIELTLPFFQFHIGYVLWY